MIDLDDFAFLTMCAEEDVRERRNSRSSEPSYSYESNDYDSENDDERDEEDY